MSRSQLAYEHIRAKLVRERIDPIKGLSELHLAKELQISRTPVREAIRRLESEGLLEQRPKRGTFVRRLDRRELDEIFQVRLLLEPFAAAEAADHIRAADLAKLHRLTQRILQIARRFRSASRMERYEELWFEHRAADIAFHEVLLKAAGNQRLVKIIVDAEILLSAMSFPETTISDAVAVMARNYRQHARIYHAVKRGDAQLSEKRMRDHLSLGWHQVGRFLESLRDQVGGGQIAVAEVLPAQPEEEWPC